MDKKGFSLVEMLVVIIIISFLVALLIPGYLSIYTTIRRNSFETKVSQIEKAALKIANAEKDSVKDAPSSCKSYSIDKLIESGELSSDSDTKAEIISPIDKQPLQGRVVVCYCKSALDIKANYVETYDPNKTYHKGEKVIEESTGKMFLCLENASPGKLYADYVWTQPITTAATTNRVGDSTAPTYVYSTRVPTNSKYFKEITC